MPRVYNGNDGGNDVRISLLWAVGIIVVFGYLAIRKYQQTTLA